MMLRKVTLRSFKKFTELQLRFGQLTVLTGLNGSGKSSVLQALLLARLASLGEGRRVPLHLQEVFDLGEASDVLNSESKASVISVEVEGPGPRAVWQFDASDSSEGYTPYLGVLKRPASGGSPLVGGVDSFVYLSAERNGPRTTYSADASTNAAVMLSPDGAFVAGLLAAAERSEVEATRRNPRAGGVVTLAAQTEAWLSTIVGPTQLRVTQVPRTGIAILELREAGSLREWMLPTNTGFGISYALPIVVAALSIRKGGLLMVDSPEGHLHPAGQSAMGRFLSVMASAGVQIITETHSDHVLNGVRRQAVESHSRSGHDIAIAFFDRGQTHREIRVNPDGSLTEWPEKFFDQLENDLGFLARSQAAFKDRP